MSEAQQLYRLQEIDSEILEKKQRLVEVLKAQKETSAVQAARQAKETAVVEWEKWTSRQKDLNTILDDINRKAKRSEDRLYSGNVKNPKELSDIQKEIASLKRRAAEVEDDILEAMVMLEDAEAEKEQAETELTAVEASWQQALIEYQAEQKTLALRLHALQQARQGPIKFISERALADYNRIGKRKGGVAVAKLRADRCLGCRLTISANDVRRVQQGELIHCINCGRLLVMA